MKVSRVWTGKNIQIILSDIHYISYCFNPRFGKLEERAAVIKQGGNIILDNPYEIDSLCRALGEFRTENL